MKAELLLKVNKQGVFLLDNKTYEELIPLSILFVCVFWVFPFILYKFHCNCTCGSDTFSFVNFIK